MFDPARGAVADDAVGAESRFGWEQNELKLFREHGRRGVQDTSRRIYLTIRWWCVQHQYLKSIS